jgi:DNA-binding response OmpR family regulator
MSSIDSGIMGASSLPESRAESDSSRLQTCFHLLARIEEQLMFADSKAGIIATLQAFLTSPLVYNVALIRKAFAVWDPASRVLLGGCLGAYSVLLPGAGVAVEGRGRARPGDRPRDHHRPRRPDRRGRPAGRGGHLQLPPSDRHGPGRDGPDHRWGEQSMNRDAHILIVDDEPNVRLVFRTALESAGYSVTTAEDGEKALTWLEDAPFDLVLLDLLMPGVGGMEALERLREAGHEVPVVIVTAHGDVPHAVQAMKLGAIDFLAKPLSPETLRTVVAEVLARHASRWTEPRTGTPTTAPEPVTVASQFVANLMRAKRALNNRWFDEAEVFLKQAIGLDGNSAEAHNLMGVLHELRNEHDASYREYRAALKADRHYEPAKHNMLRYYERFTFGKSNVPVDLGEA